ncbi:MAG: signal peptidase II [Pseudomonadota bacterium]
MMARLTPGPFVWLVPITIVIDQICKWFVEARLAYAEPVPFVPFISLYRTWNEGIAFSMLAGMDKIAIVAIALVVLMFVTYLWWSAERRRWLSRLGFALIWGGAVGNLIDRIWHGHVIDFILVHTQTWSFAIFNTADSFISVGAGAVILDELLMWWRSRSGGADHGSSDGKTGV